MSLTLNLLIEDVPTFSRQYFAKILVQRLSNRMIRQHSQIQNRAKNDRKVISLDDPRCS